MYIGVPKVQDPALLAGRASLTLYEHASPLHMFTKCGRSEQTVREYVQGPIEFGSACVY